MKPIISESINIDLWDHPANVVRPYISMTDRYVLYPSNKTSTALWDMDAGKHLGMLEGHTSMVQSSGINNAGSMAVTIAFDPEDEDDKHYSVKIWNLGTMQCTANLTSTSMACNLFKDRLLLVDESDIKVWGLGGSTPVALMGLQGHKDGNILSMTGSDIGNAALSGSLDNYVRLWDLRTGRCVRVMERHAEQIFSVSMDATCQVAVGGSMHKTVSLWDMGSGRLIGRHTLDHSVYSVKMHESGSSILVTSGYMFLHAFTTATGKDQQPFMDVDLSSLCSPNTKKFPRMAASGDFSRVGLCYLNAERNGLGVSVWK